MAIDWTKPIEVYSLTTKAPAEFVGYDDIDCRYIVKWNSETTHTTRFGSFDAYGCGTTFSIRNIPVPKRRGELFVTIGVNSEGMPFASAPHVGRDHNKLMFAATRVSVVKIGEWEEGDFRADQAKAQETR